LHISYTSMNRKIKNRIIRNLEGLNAMKASTLEEMNDKLILTEVDLRKIHDEMVFPLENLIAISNHYKISLDDIFKIDFFELSEKEKKDKFHSQNIIIEDDNFEIAI